MQASMPTPGNPPINKAPFFGGAGIVFQVFTWIYLLLMATQIIISLGNRPQGSLNLYRVIMFSWMLIQAIILALVGATLYQVFTMPQQPGQSFWNMLITVGLTGHKGTNLLLSLFAEAFETHRAPPSAPLCSVSAPLTDCGGFARSCSWTRGT